MGATSLLSNHKHKTTLMIIQKILDRSQKTRMLTEMQLDKDTAQEVSVGHEDSPGS